MSKFNEGNPTAVPGLLAKLGVPWRANQAGVCFTSIHSSGLSSTAISAVLVDFKLASVGFLNAMELNGMGEKKNSVPAVPMGHVTKLCDLSLLLPFKINK